MGLGDTVAYLCSDRAGYINGQASVLDGGSGPFQSVTADHYRLSRLIESRAGGQQFPCDRQGASVSVLTLDL